MSAFLSPVFGAGAQLFTNQGIVLSGGKIYTYQAGSTTPFTTWTDSTQTVSNANPIILDSAGRVPNEIWLQASQTYKLILKDSNDVTLGTWDNVAGLNDVSALSISEWLATGLTPAYVSATSFSVTGNHTGTFTANRRIQAVVSAGTVYGYIVSSTYSSPSTTVVIQPDSTGLDSGLSSVNVGLLSSVNTSTPQQLLQMNAPVTVASASTTPIGAALSTNVIVSGTVTITAFDNVLSGIIKFVKFSGILTITHNGTSLILPGAVNITTGVGDEAIFRSLGSGNWECLNYQVAANDTVTIAHAITADNVSGGTANVTSLTNTGTTTLATSLTGLLRADAGVVSSTGKALLKFTAILASNPTFTPDTKTTSMLIVCIGGGGNGGNGAASGGGGGGGGGPGNVAIGTITTVSGTYNATVGGAGGTTSFGGVVSAVGGSNGSNASTTTGGAGGYVGGAGVGGAAYSTGTAGEKAGTRGGNGGNGVSGAGAGGGGGGGVPSLIYIAGPGTGGQGAPGSTHFDGTAATANSGCGGGGGGGLVTADPAGSGGAGGSGVILVWEFE